jgi:hypothetical protein
MILWRRCPSFAIALGLALAVTGCGAKNDKVSREPVASSPASKDPPRPTEAPTRGCQRRVEIGRPSEDPTPQQVVIGPGYFDGDFAWDDPSAKPRPGQNMVDKKVGFTLRARTSATLVVPVRHRRDLILDYVIPRPRRKRPSVANGVFAIEFRSCSPDEQARSGRYRIGEWTRWNGGFRYRRPGCYTIELYEGENPVPHKATMSFAAGRCTTTGSG